MIRQYEVRHEATGAVFRVNHPRRGSWEWDGKHVCDQLGFRHVSEAFVRLVPIGQEIPLAFDEIPLMVRRPNAQTLQEAA